MENKKSNQDISITINFSCNKKYATGGCCSSGRATYQPRVYMNPSDDPCYPFTKKVYHYDTQKEKRVVEDMLVYLIEKYCLLNKED